jgi:integrase
VQELLGHRDVSTTTDRLAIVRRQNEQRPYSFGYDFTASYPDDQKAE